MQPFGNLMLAVGLTMHSVTNHICRHHYATMQLFGNLSTIAADPVAARHTFSALAEKGHGEAQQMLAFVYAGRFRQRFTLEDAIEFRAFASLEALACVRPIAFLSGVHSSYRLAL
jgi:hypothetical protein